MLVSLGIPLNTDRRHSTALEYPGLRIDETEGRRMKTASNWHRFALHPLAFCLCCIVVPTQSFGKDYLTITANPSGRNLELDGLVVGTTPYSVEIPGAYLHGSHSVFGKLLRHQIHLKLTLDGYLSKEMDIADGPTAWIALNGTNHGDFWILKSATFNLTLGKAGHLLYWKCTSGTF